MFDELSFEYFYKDIVTKNQTDKEVNFLIKELYLHLDDKILDLACGYARHSIELAKLGYSSIIAIDSNNRVILNAQNILKNYNYHINFINADIQNICYSNVFNKIFLFYYYFNYYDKIDFFRKIYNSLKLKGLFCFNFRNKSYYQKKGVKNKSNEILKKQNIYSKGILYEFRLLTNLNMRLFDYVEIKNLLQKIGFSILKAYGNWDLNKDIINSENIIIIAEK